jgi:hypothetical protein
MDALTLARGRVTSRVMRLLATAFLFLLAAGCAHSGSSAASPGRDCPEARRALLNVVRALTKASGTLRTSSNPSESAHLAGQIDQIATELGSFKLQHAGLKQHFGDLTTTLGKLTRGMRLLAAALAGRDDAAMRRTGQDLVDVLTELKQPIESIRALCPGD